MSQNIRREIIGKNLGIKPINHGQVYIFQIALPDEKRQPLSLERRQAIERILLEYQSNLVSLILRRTDAYDDEDIEYELVHGSDWLQIAKDLDIEKLWAWVFDISEEQATDVIKEIELLTPDSQDSTPNTTDIFDTQNSDLASLIETKLQLAIESIKNSITPILNGIRDDLDERLKIINNRIDTLSSTNSNHNELVRLIEKLDAIQQSTGSSRKLIEPIPNPINLLEASEKDIEISLRKVKARKPQIKAAIDVIRYWKKSEHGLSWENLEFSSTSSQEVKGFGQKTYEQLQIIGKIPSPSEAE
ncbi:MAG: hypothetical protein WBA57_13080 [Elainellaceae cyanobacterium]